jgi:antirestriction protein ArdC
MITETEHLACVSNEVTGAAYQGGNIGRLLEATVGNGYDPEHGWAGFTQWRSIGRTVRKGEHGTPCLTVVTVDRDAEGNGGTRKPRGFRVFHFDQTDELATREQVA